MGEQNPSPKYSGVQWRGVWVIGKTIIEGWAKSEHKYHAYHVYTVDDSLHFANGIHAGAGTKVLEDFFNARMYDIEREKICGAEDKGAN